MNLLDQTMRTGFRSWPVVESRDEETGELKSNYWLLPKGFMSPIKRVVSPTAPSDEPILRPGARVGEPPFPLWRQLTGRTRIGTKTLLEEELDTYKLEAWVLFPKIKGDPELTEMARKMYQQVVENQINPAIMSKRYRDTPATLKRGFLKTIVTDARGNVMKKLEGQVLRNLNSVKKDSPAWERSMKQLVRIVRIKLSRSASSEIIERAIQDYQQQVGDLPNLSDVNHLNALIEIAKKITAAQRR